MFILILIYTLGISTIICLYYLDNASMSEQDTAKYKLANIWVYIGVSLLTIIASFSIPHQTSNNDSFAEEDAKLSEITIQRDSLATKELIYHKLLREKQTDMINSLNSRVPCTADELILLDEVNTLEAKIDSIEYVKTNL